MDPLESSVEAELLESAELEILTESEPDLDIPVIEQRESFEDEPVQSVAPVALSIDVPHIDLPRLASDPALPLLALPSVTSAAPPSPWADPARDPLPLHVVRPPLRRASSGLWLAGILLVVGVGIGGAVGMAVPTSTLARWRTILDARTPASSPVAPPPVVAPAPVPAPAPAPSSSAQPETPTTPTTPTMPTMDVASLPKPVVDSKTGIVTFPASARGHRIFVDGRAVASGTAPAKLKCGSHMIRIGSAGKARKVVVPCGGELSLE